MNSNFKIGSFVRNLDLYIARIVGFHEITGDFILQGYSHGMNGTRWIADHTTCELIGEPDAPLRHKDGLVSIG